MPPEAINMSMDMGDTVNLLGAELLDMINS